MDFHFLSSLLRKELRTGDVDRRWYGLLTFIIDPMGSELCDLSNALRIFSHRSRQFESENETKTVLGFSYCLPTANISDQPVQSKITQNTYQKRSVIIMHVPYYSFLAISCNNKELSFQFYRTNNTFRTNVTEKSKSYISLEVWD
jgi:hypothetical protein